MEDLDDDEDGKNDIVILVPHLLRCQHEDQHVDHEGQHEDQHLLDLKHNVDQHEGQHNVDHDGGAWVMHDNNTPRDDDDMDDDEIEEVVDVDSMAIDVDGILPDEKKMVQNDDNVTK